jgi:hypothetical protein
MADLFDLPALGHKLQAQIDTGSAIEARRIAQAWLASATRLTEWPTPIPEDLRAWALELAALVYDNPSWLEMEQVEGNISRWALSRRNEILREARERYGAAAGIFGPLYAFPEVSAWPDPVQPYPDPFPVSWRLQP